MAEKYLDYQLVVQIVQIPLSRQFKNQILTKAVKSYDLAAFCVSETQ
jgi:hypothetical protein